MNAVYAKYLAVGEETIKTRQVEWKSQGEKSEKAEYGDRESSSEHRPQTQFPASPAAPATGSIRPS